MDTLILVLFISYSLTFPPSPPQEESLTYKGQLDCLEAEILKQREEMNRLQITNNDQQLSIEATKVTYKLLCDELRAYMFPDTV